MKQKTLVAVLVMATTFAMACAPVRLGTKAAKGAVKVATVPVRAAF